MEFGMNIYSDNCQAADVANCLKIKRTAMKRFYIPCIFLALTVANGISAQNADVQILESLQNCRTTAMDGVIQWTSNSLFATPAVPLGLMAAGWANDNTQTLHAGYITGISYIATFALTEGLKFTIQRPRPYKSNPDRLSPVRPTLGFSFPSGHTSLCFATAVSLSLCYPKWYVVTPLMLWATGVGFSRLYLGVHDPSDVIAGAIIGSLTALLVHSLCREHWQQSSLPAPKFLIPIAISF